MIGMRAASDRITQPPRHTNGNSARPPAKKEKKHDRQERRDARDMRDMQATVATLTARLQRQPVGEKHTRLAVDI